MAKKDEERYALTFKGLLSTYVSDYLAKQICDGMELYCYRRKFNESPAVVLEDGHWVFREVRCSDD